MKALEAGESRGTDALDPVIEEVRMRFIADFPLRCDTAARLLTQSLDPERGDEAAQSLRSLAHRLAGLAGIIGFRRVSAVASDLEEMMVRLESRGRDHETAGALVESLRAAFTEEVAAPATHTGGQSNSVTRGIVLDFFLLRWDTAARLLAQSLDPGRGDKAAQSLRSLAHRLAGLSGNIGFRRVSALASDLEEMMARLESRGRDYETAGALIDSLRAAFTEEVAAPAMHTRSQSNSVTRGTILIAEDDDDQRAVLSTCLRDAGYRVEGVVSGDSVLERARALRPSVVLLDVEMPGIDGYSVCRQLKADATLGAIPVLFLTARTRLDDRLAGLTLGADDYLAKPVDLGELLIRLDRVRGRFEACAQAAGTTRALSFEEFAQVSRSRIARSAASLVLIRLPAEELEMATAHVTSEIRRTDLAGYYDRSHLMLLFSGLSGIAASARTAEIIAGLAALGLEGAAGGVACSGPDESKPLETMLIEADQALMQARHFGKPAVVYGELVDRDGVPSRGSVLVADDDPDVIRIVDAQMRGAGYRTTLTFDGAEALAAIESTRPDVLILDLMMPKISGFDLLARLKSAPSRPKVLVLSARGREDDVTRAFELGADDYVTKPFNPQELLARVARLSR